MRIEWPVENNGQQLRGAFRRARGFLNGIATLGVVRSKLAEAFVEPEEGPVMRRQHKRILGHARFQFPKRAQIEAQGIAVRIGGPDADIRRDFLHRWSAAKSSLSSAQ